MAARPSLGHAPLWGDAQGRGEGLMSVVISVFSFGCIPYCFKANSRQGAHWDSGKPYQRAWVLKALPSRGGRSCRSCIQQHRSSVVIYLYLSLVNEPCASHPTGKNEDASVRLQQKKMGKYATSQKSSVFLPQGFSLTFMLQQCPGHLDGFWCLSHLV